MNIAHDPLYIPEAVNFINQLMPTLTVDKIAAATHVEFDQTWRSWLQNSTYNTVHGLKEFKHSCFSLGTTPAFGEFISRYPTRRVRVSRSDFVITKILSRTYGRSFQHIEDGPLESTDCVILSVPFSGNGSYHPDHIKLLDCADEIDVPVFIDGAYFGISHGVDYPLDRKCVTDFATSLSKHLSGVPFRMGVRFTKEPIDDTITASLIGSNVFDRLNAYISIQLLNQFSHKWIIDKYQPISKQVCLANNLTPSNTVSITLGGNEYKEFKRGDYRRVCISEELNRVP